MTKDQTSILWLGLILVALNIIIDIDTFKSVIFGGGSSNAPSASPPAKSNPPLAPGPPPKVVAPNAPQQPQNTPPGTVVV